MEKILLFEDFIEDLSLSEEEQAEIRNFMNKYSKYSEFHDDAQFEDSVDDIVNDVMKQFSFPEGKREDVKAYITSLQDLSDGLSVIMEPNKEFIYRTQPDNVQSFIM
jgi:hypothetical protein